ncbi:Bicaudal D-related-like protein [Sarcoptes scabiei]|uniref:Bicaudal D-related-like protein n=1 Tax=Sarcoptes scabiei TaxID=52283 RepID=A0A132A949_SARSC|nr:Bicaudal D-related-like protein [Sarcoptes scabiei]
MKIVIGGDDDAEKLLLEQEKYALRKKLNSIEIEYENKIHDLQADLKSARENLQTRFEINKQNDLENNRLITELSEQNRRLTSELKESSNRESQLEKEILSLKEQCCARRTNFSDHIGQLEGLRDEINLLNNRKRELETKISALNEEKVNISITLDESQYKILSMEKELFEKELGLQNQQKDIEDLRRMNIQYQNKIDSLIKNKLYDSNLLQVSSLYNEIEMSSHSSFDEPLSPAMAIHQHPHHTSFSVEDDVDQFNIYCNRCIKNKQEIGEIFQKLKHLFDDLLKHRQNLQVKNASIANGNPSTGSCLSDCSDQSSNESSSSMTNNNQELNASNNNSSNNNNNHDSGIQTNLGVIEECNLVICDIISLIKNLESMVSVSFD